LERQVALVIGNSNYITQNDLKNPGNDARLMKSTLEKLGFKVHFYLDANSKQLLEAVRRFHADLTPGSIGAFFFSGNEAPGR